jgi:hypothetical protein
VKQHKEEDIGTDGNRCFNHMMKLPTKEGKKKPIFIRNHYMILYLFQTGMVTQGGIIYYMALQEVEAIIVLSAYLV